MFFNRKKYGRCRSGINRARPPLRQIVYRHANSGLSTLQPLHDLSREYGLVQLEFIDHLGSLANCCESILQQLAAIAVFGSSPVAVSLEVRAKKLVEMTKPLGGFIRQFLLTQDAP